MSSRLARLGARLARLASAPSRRARSSPPAALRGWIRAFGDDAPHASRSPPHPAMPARPTWSTAELLDPPPGAVEASPIDVATLRDVARRALVHLPPGDLDAERDALRGVNEVLRFVRALDDVALDDASVEPMWTPLPSARVAPAREDVLACGDDAVGTPAGWLPLDRDELMRLAPRRGKDREEAKHHYRAPSPRDEGVDK